MSSLSSTAPVVQVVPNDDEVLVVRNRNDHRFWIMDATDGKNFNVKYPKGLIRTGVSGCVSIGFYIEADGSTSKYRVLKSIIGDSSSGMLGKKNKQKVTSMFGNSAVKYLEAIRFSPGTENPSRKRGFAQVQISFSTEAIPLRGNCDIPDLEVFLDIKIGQLPVQ
ncbi:MAG: hypothetical protein ACREO1_14410 [Arenimonas sp.]